MIRCQTPDPDLAPTKGIIHLVLPLISAALDPFGLPRLGGRECDVTHPLGSPIS